MAYDQCFNFPKRLIILKGPSWRDHMVVGFITTYAISAYHHKSCEFESRSWRGVLDTTLCGKVCQWLATGRWISPVLGFSSTHKTDRHDITEILLKMALNTMYQTKPNQTLLLRQTYSIFSQRHLVRLTGMHGRYGCEHYSLQ